MSRRCWWNLPFLRLSTQKILIGSVHTGKRNIIDRTHTDKKGHLWEKTIISNMTKHWDIHVSLDVLFHRLFIASILVIIFHVNPNSYMAGLGIVDRQYPAYILDLRTPPHPLSHCKENPIYVFLFWELRGLSPNFHIHVSMSDFYIPRIGPHISLQQNRRTNPGNIYISHRYMSVGIGRQIIILLFWK
jgi:hypothetical protein